MCDNFSAKVAGDPGCDVTDHKDKNKRLDSVVAKARAERESREQGYRARALKMYPWVCGRCAREFTQQNLHELTVHHRDHDHDNNPEDGSNWELLCLYCHDNEHARHADFIKGASQVLEDEAEPLTYRPFADLGSLLDKKK